MADLGIQQSPAVPTHVAGVRSGTIADWKRRPLVVAAYPLPLVLSMQVLRRQGVLAEPSIARVLL
jgi:hypothetical protein